MKAARRFYGHPHTLSGVVQSGRHLGHKLGFPTANLLPPPELVLPRDGVYAVRGTVRHSEQSEESASPDPSTPLRGPQDDGGVFIGVCNVGTRPTVGGHHRTVETWLDGFEGELYGRQLTVDFYRYLRPEQKFDSLEALRQQVERDMAAALAYFSAL